MAEGLPRVPSATYRFQFRKEFTLQRAEELLDYLDCLGIQGVYCSPLLQARSGSPHGYDVVNHNHLNPEIGTEKQFQHFSDILHYRGMDLLLDIVPNHMGADETNNKWWIDLLKNGQASRYSDYFDIDWTRQNGRLLLPLLGGVIGQVLENGELQLVYDRNLEEFRLQYFQTLLPVDLKSVLHVLGQAVKNNSELFSLQSIVEQDVSIPDHNIKMSHQEKEARYRIATQLEDRLRRALQNPTIFKAVTDYLTQFNGVKGNASSFDGLFSFIDAQPYRLCYWRTANDEINYRRFFDINELICLRVEDEQVFRDSHLLLFQLIKEGRIDGLRIDHIDGLYDPAGYLKRLQEATSALVGRPFYVIVEKILEGGERLIPSWEAYGTTGYEFMNVLNGVFVNTANEKKFRTFYGALCKSLPPYEVLLKQCKEFILDTSMESDLHSLAKRLKDIFNQNRRYRDYSQRQIKLALREIICCFPVYRTYLSLWSDNVTSTDRNHIGKALERSRENRYLDKGLLEAIGLILLRDWRFWPQLNNLDSTSVGLQEQLRHFVVKLQQLSGPVMAKGLEDTTFYRYFLLTSLNEVGGDPNQFGITDSQFHEHNQYRMQNWAFSLSTTSTHDTKRSEDMRCRLNVLSEIPEEFFEHIRKWMEGNSKYRVILRDLGSVPHPNEEYFIYQTMIGVWPLDRSKPDAELIHRLEQYFRKAVKESKLYTSWTVPNREYEDGIIDFVKNILGDQQFLRDFVSFTTKVADYGLANSLSQVVLKLTSPGIPDVYQGTEMWDFSLVDPDNRREVDFSLRKNVLGTFCSGIVKPSLELLGDLMQNISDGRIKLYVTMALLNLRRDKWELFGHDSLYTPLHIQGSKANHVIAFARSKDSQSVIVAAGRFFTSLCVPGSSGRWPSPSCWEDTEILVSEIPASEHTRYRDVLTGHIYRPTKLSGGFAFQLQHIFQKAPFAVLEEIIEEDHFAPKPSYRGTFGAFPVHGDMGVEFRVWAPSATQVSVVFYDQLGQETFTVPLSSKDPHSGIFHGTVTSVAAGILYKYKIDGRGPFPDPASRYQPLGVHGPSQVMKTAGMECVCSENWAGCPSADGISIYELHVGTFTPEGTYLALEERLPYIKDLGVKVIELMPLGDFPGDRNWGYDGVCLYAPSRAYGSPESLRRLISTAHKLGLAIIVDLVYNHLGPDGNYLSEFSPYYFTKEHHTPWGAALNIDLSIPNNHHAKQVRKFLIENCLYWIHEFGFDGARLDAVHALVDSSEPHFLQELVHTARQSTHKHLLFFAEDETNNTALVLNPPRGYGLNGVWADDFHHQIRVMLAGDREAYFADFQGTSEDLALTCSKGWFYCGQPKITDGKPRGHEPIFKKLSSSLICLQNHDQVGNRAMGERLHHQIDWCSYKAASVLLLLAPETPILFMGQEFATSSPFLFFTDHNPELGKLVTEGRRQEFSKFKMFSDPVMREKIPDPQAVSTFQNSKLKWEETNVVPNQRILELYKALLHLRNSHPALSNSVRLLFEATALSSNTVVLTRKSPTSSDVLVAVVHLKGQQEQVELNYPFVQNNRTIQVILTTEEDRFLLPTQTSEMAPSVSQRCGALQVQFYCPGAILFHIVGAPKTVE